MVQMQNLISIIVPVYNVEQYLLKCVDSLINQTYQNIEIILVDDGSNDNSGTICDEYAKKDERIKVCHKLNGGLSEARNAGIDICTGEYIVFIDSDDWVDKEYIEYLYSLILKDDSSIAICEIVMITDCGKIYNRCKNDGIEKVFSPKDAVYQLLKADYYSTSACAKIYKMDLFKSIRFPVGKLYEDIPVTYELFLSGVTVVFGARGLYYYRTRDHSITTVKYTPRRMDAVVFINSAMDEVQNKYPEFENEIRVRRFMAYYNVISCLGDDEESKACWKKIKMELKKYRWGIIFSKERRKQDLLKAIISLLSYKQIQWIMNFKKKSRK